MQQPETFSACLLNLVKPENPLFRLMPKKYQATYNFKLWLEKYAFKDVLETIIPSGVDIKEAFNSDSIKLSTMLTPDIDPEIVAIQGFIRVGSSRDELKKFHVGNCALKDLITIGIDFKITVVEVAYLLNPENLKHKSIGVIRLPAIYIKKDSYPFASEYGIETENDIFIPLNYIRSLPYCGLTTIIDNRVFKREEVAERIAKGGITGMVSE